MSEFEKIEDVTRATLSAAIFGLLIGSLVWLVIVSVIQLLEPSRPSNPSFSLTEYPSWAVSNEKLQ